MNKADDMAKTQSTTSTGFTTMVSTSFIIMVLQCCGKLLLLLLLLLLGRGSNATAAQNGDGSQVSRGEFRRQMKVRSEWRERASPLTAHSVGSIDRVGV